MMNTTEQIKYIEDIESFLEHNINVNYITKDTTVEQLIQFLDNIKNNYIPMMANMEQIETTTFNRRTNNGSMGIWNLR
jgi:hypothetical protein